MSLRALSALSVSILLACASSAAADADADAEAEEAAIRAAHDEYLAAWHARDTSAMARFLDEEYDWINPIGMKLSGRSAYLAYVGQSSGRELPPGVERVLRYDIGSIRLLRDDLAIVDGSYRMTGAGPDPAAPFEGGFVSVLAKEDGRWVRLSHRGFARVQPRPR